MGLYRSIAGVIKVKLTGADITGAMTAITDFGIHIGNMESVDDLSITFSTARRFLPALRAIADKRGDRLEVLGTSGLYRLFCRVLRRPALTVGLALMILFGIYLPGRILFVSVEGNSQIPDKRILEAALDSGIRFGASRRGVRSEEVKNSLLSELPELQWAGVNTYGCQAVITVRERTGKQKAELDSPVSSIIASRDGIISSVTVTKGSGQCVPGQAVRKGQVLISGYMDSGLVVTATRAEGDVMGITSRRMEAIMPSNCLQRLTTTQESVKYSIRFGKKRINFYKGSGISVGSCVKMYSEYILTLPGGFPLPVVLIKESVSVSDTVMGTCDDVAGLSGFAQDYLKRAMIAGSIHNAVEQVEDSDGVIRLTGQYACTEMIGRRQSEMIGENNGKSDGADRECGSGG